MDKNIGKKYNSLLIIERVVRNNGKRNYTGYKCLCECGNIKPYTSLIDLHQNKVQSCGCRTSETIRQKLIKNISGKIFGSLLVVSKLQTRTTDGYDYLCKCICGKEKIVKYNNLVRGDTKSCGCKSDYYNSINNGGTGIPRENFDLQKRIRLCKQYRHFVKLCLQRAENKSELSGQSGKLEVHHIQSVSDLILKYNLTEESYLQCSLLFDPVNAIVLTEKEHKFYHTKYGRRTTKNEWQAFEELYLSDTLTQIK